jgi:exosome complex component RRP42
MNNYVKSILEKGLRIDGRNLDELRKPIKIELGISNKAEGSAKVTLGETEVAVGVKLDVGEPYTDSPDEGVLITTTELLPLSSPDFDPGPPGQQATELARVVDRGVRESGMIDFKKLCVKKGELVWLVNLDIYTLNDAGNLIDCAALAAVAALNNSFLPKLEKDRVKYGELTKQKLPIKKIPITCTLFKIGDHMLLDADTEEEKAIDARLTVAVLENGDICALQKGGDCSLTVDEIDNMVGIAIEKSKKLRGLLK